MNPDGEPLPAQPARQPRRRWPWWLGAFAVLVIALGGWVGFRTFQAYQALAAARVTISTNLQLTMASLIDTDRATLTAAIADVQTDARNARSAVEDPLFRMATVLPWIGGNLDAVRTVAETVDDLAQQVLPALEKLADAADPAALEPHDSTVDLSPIIAAAPVLETADTRVSGFVDRLDSVDRTGLLGPVDNALSDLTGNLVAMHTVTTSGARLTALLPPMLGSTGTRRYLVLFQNLAEVRSTGGMFGSYAVLTADNGHLTVSGQGATQRTISRFDTPVAPLTTDELNLYYRNIVTIPMDVNFTPDFPRAAALFTTMYQQRVDPAPLDGVVAIDPVALADILKGFEPVAVDGASLTSASLVQLLLSDAYTLFPDDKDQTQRDAFLANASATAFTMMTTAPKDVQAVISGIRLSAQTRRLMVYSAHPGEEADLRTSGFTGQMPDADPATSPTFGIFLADRTTQGSKLSYYMSGGVTLTAGSCQTDGSREVTAQMSMVFAGPTGGLPLHVAGAGAKAYTLTDEYRVFAPTGGTILAVEVNGAPAEITAGSDLGRSAVRFTVDFPPGTTTAVTLHFRLPPVQTTGTIRPTVFIAPGVKDWDLVTPGYPSCS